MTVTNEMHTCLCKARTKMNHGIKPKHITYQNFVVLASQKFPGIWHRLFDQPLYIDFGGVFSFSVRVWSWKLFQI